MPRRLMVLIPIVLMFLPQVRGEEKVIIAVASDGKTLEADVSLLAARAPYFLMVDGEGKLMEAVENPYQDTRGGAGVSAAHFLADKNVTVVIARNFGNKMIGVLKAQDIAYVKFEGIGGDAVKKILEKEGCT
jgi:predicted Fe-Mo cluster-binding NifX family protein